MKFGLKYSPDPFQRALEIFLTAYMWKKCLFYSNDIIIVTKDEEFNLQDVSMELDRANVTTKFKNVNYSLIKSDTSVILSIWTDCLLTKVLSRNLNKLNNDARNKK